MQGIFLILHNIRSIHNVGSIFRTADAAGVTKVYLTGYTPAPIDRFGRARKDFAKVSLGAEQSVPWETRKDIFALLRELKTRGVQIIALEQNARAILYTKVRVKFPTALLVGSETEGVPQSILKHCAAIAEIPMRGTKESLNVSVAAGIALFQLFSRKQKKIPRLWHPL